MIIDNFEEIKNNLYPVIIVGSGPAGISLALKLEKQKINCLILEAGKEKYDHQSQQFYEGIVIGDSITNLKHSRLRQLGGTSGHWGGWCKPMDRYNIDTLICFCLFFALIVSIITKNQHYVAYDHFPSSACT